MSIFVWKILPILNIMQIKYSFFFLISVFEFILILDFSFFIYKLLFSRTIENISSSFLFVKENKTWIFSKSNAKKENIKENLFFKKILSIFIWEKIFLFPRKIIPLFILKWKIFSLFSISYIAFKLLNISFKKRISKFFIFDFSNNFFTSKNKYFICSKFNVKGKNNFK